MAFWSTDAYGIQDEDDSSDINTSSSEDEIDIILKGTTEQKKKLKRLQNKPVSNRFDESERKRRNESSSSEDEFEKEMNAELVQHVNFLEKSRVPGVSERLALTGGSQQGPQGNQTEDSFYDNVYFDSDEEEDDGNYHSESRKHAVISNDDLLYDPTMDDKDQMWVDKQRRKNNNTTLEGLAPKNNKPRKLPTSDALLDCPACLTTLCLDCQRHETYKHQYRAMFVMNCVVDSTEQLQCPEQQTKAKRKKKKTMENDSGQNSILDGATGSDLFHSVKCTECNTVVGVIDSDEVYHFFNVLSSHT